MSVNTLLGASNIRMKHKAFERPLRVSEEHVVGTDFFLANSKEDNFPPPKECTYSEIGKRVKSEMYYC